MDLSTIGFRIRERRKKLNMTGSALAEEIGISDKKTISTWENGKIPKLENIILLADALKCDPEYLLGCVDHPKVETAWISEKIPLSDKAIEYLMWIKGLEKKYPEQYQIESGMIDAVLCALEAGINDDVNSIRWNGEELYYLLAQANEEDEMNPYINHSLFIRQAFCMAFGGVAFDYVSEMANKNMKRLRELLEEVREEVEREELIMQRIGKLREALGLTDVDAFHDEIEKHYIEGDDPEKAFDKAMAEVLGCSPEWLFANAPKQTHDVIAEALEARPKLMELFSMVKDDEEAISQMIEMLGKEVDKNGNI